MEKSKLQKVSKLKKKKIKDNNIHKINSRVGWITIKFETKGFKHKKRLCKKSLHPSCGQTKGAVELDPTADMP